MRDALSSTKKKKTRGEERGTGDGAKAVRDVEIRVPLSGLALV